MSSDLRGFRFALEPLLQRQSWQFEALQHRIARQQKQVAEAEATKKAVETSLATVCDDVARQTVQRLTPETRQQQLLWMARLRQELQDAQRKLDQLQHEKNNLQAELRKRQASMQVIRDHRQDCLKDYSMERERHQSAVADQEWMARQTFRHGCL